MKEKITLPCDIVRDLLPLYHDGVCSEESKDLLDKIKEILKDKVQDVKLSSRLKTYPACLVSDDMMSIEMEKVFRQMNQEGMKANKILEITGGYTAAFGMLLALTAVALALNLLIKQPE